MSREELKIIKEELTVGDIVEGYDEDEYGNVIGYGEKLNIRPPLENKESMLNVMHMHRAAEIDKTCPSICLMRQRNHWSAW